MRLFWFLSVLCLFSFQTSFAEDSNHSDHGHHHHEATLDDKHSTQQSKILHLKLLTASFTPEQPTEVRFQLLDDAQKPVSQKQLATVHTQKMHMMIVDENLEDYHHLHPTVVQENGQDKDEYVVRFTPKHHGRYRLWLEVQPEGGKSQTLQAQINSPENISTASRTLAQPSLVSTAGEYTMKLGLVKPMNVNDGNLVVIRLYGKDGKPASDILESYMGAFAHGACFSADGAEFIHVHPAGKEPTSEKERGDASQALLITPTRAGFYKLFVQVKIHGNVMTFPFILKAIIPTP